MFKPNPATVPNPYKATLPKLPITLPNAYFANGRNTYPNSFYDNILNIEKDNVDEIYVVTDNVEKSSHYIKQLNTFDKPIKIIEGEPMYVDMMILSFCSTLIMGPSTLSAWSAYLNKHNNVYTPSIWTRHHWTNDIPNTWKIY